jgi:hypothetical protein
MKNENIFLTAPYPLEIYRNLLSEVTRSDRYHCRSYIPVRAVREDKVNIFFRHDIDFFKCIANMDALIQLHIDFGIGTNIYFRVDDEEYSLAAYRETVREYHRQGIEVGLHTLCYIKDDFMAEFKRETEKFCDELGIRPLSFTIHGLGSFRLETREVFKKEISTQLERFGYKFSDCLRHLFHYHSLHQDCYLTVDKKNRFIQERFISPPSYLKVGQSCMVLTHPGYWQI